MLLEIGYLCNVATCGEVSPAGLFFNHTHGKEGSPIAGTASILPQGGPT